MVKSNHEYSSYPKDTSSQTSSNNVANLEEKEKKMRSERRGPTAEPPEMMTSQNICLVTPESRNADVDESRDTARLRTVTF